MWTTLLSLTLLLPLQGDPTEAPAHVRELGSEHLRHAGRVVTLGHGPAGRLVASTTANGEVRLWDAVTGAPRAAHDLSESHATAHAWLGPERLLLGLRDDRLAVLDLDGDRLVPRDPFDLGLGDLASIGGGLSAGPEGRRLAIWQLAGIGGALMLADLEAPARIPVSFPGFRAIGGAWNRDGSRMAVVLTNPFKALGRKDTGDQDSGRLLILDTATGEVVTTIHSPDDYLHAAVWGPGEGADALLVGAGDQGLHLWEAGSGRELARFGGVEEARLLDLVPTADGDLLLASNPSGHLETWLLTADDAPRAVLARDLERPLGALDLAPSGTHAVASEGLAGQRYAVDGWTPDPAIPGHTGTLVALDAEGDRLVSCSLDGTLLVWRGEAASQLPRHHEGLVLGADLAPDGERLATCGQDGTLRIWSLGDEDFGTELLVRESGSTAAFTAVGFDPTGARVAAVSADGTLWIWSLEDGLLQRTFEGLRGLEFHLAWSHDGERLAVASSGARVWDTTSWELVGELADLGSPVTAVTFAPSGEALGLGLAGRAVQLRRVVDGERLAVWSDLPNRVGDLTWWSGHGLVASVRGAGAALVLGSERGEPVRLEVPRGADALVLTTTADGHLVVGDSRGFLGLWK